MQKFKCIPVISAFEPNLQKATIALLDPDISRSGWSSEIPYVRMVEEDVVVMIEFPNHESLERFLKKMAAL
ncbi:MAG: hypothetical protein GY847_26140 [Proteobacteria bacterium]|nr:hypothetical protein [Pseudomonadota bacterium]